VIRAARLQDVGTVEAIVREAYAVYIDRIGNRRGRCSTIIRR
jgi:hypothetical protein